MELSHIMQHIVAQNTKVGFRFGEITAHNSSSTPKTVDLKLSGGTNTISDVRYLYSYGSPTVGDIVLVLINDKDIIVLGDLTP